LLAESQQSFISISKGLCTKIEAPNFQKWIAMFIWVSDMLTGVGKYRYAGLHGNICVVVTLRNNFWLYMLGPLFFSKTQLHDWYRDIPTCGVELLEKQRILYPLILIVALGPNSYLLRNLLLYYTILCFTVVLT